MAIEIPGRITVSLEEEDWNPYEQEYGKVTGQVMWEGQLIFEMDVTESYEDYREDDVKEEFAKRLRKLLANPT